MEYKQRLYPLFSACGLNCGLCSRYQMDGTSKCPGCAGEGFSEKHPPCGVLSCCQRHDIEYCYLCSDYPCEKYVGADSADSFITHQNQFRDFEKAKQNGIDVYQTKLNEKIEILQDLLGNYDNGRSKSFFCIAINLLELYDIKNVMAQINKEIQLDEPIKEKSATVIRLFQDMAEKRGISLKLRKKSALLPLCAQKNNSSKDNKQ